MDDFDELESSKFVTESDDQDSLDERIDTEQRLRNQQLWASFQNAACCITKLYKDRSQPAVSLWNPFQNAASNLTTLYKDCIDSQRRFAKIGYQVGRQRRLREYKKILKRRQQQARHQFFSQEHDSTYGAQATSNQYQQQQQQSNVASILAVNQLNLDCDESPSQSMQTQPLSNQQSVPESNQQQPQNHHHNQIYDQQQQLQQHQQTQSNNGSPQAQAAGNNEEDLITFQQALVQPAHVKAIKSSGQNKRPCLNTSSYAHGRAIDPSKSEEDRLLELNQFLAEEYHRHVGSRKRSCPSGGGGGNAIKRTRE